MFLNVKHWATLVAATLLPLYFPTANATSQSTLPNTLQNLPYVVTLSAGPIWVHGNQAQTINLAPGIEKTYTVNGTAIQSLAEGELFLGLQKPLFGSFLGQLGLAFATTSQASLSGNIWDDGLPQFNNYNYNYQLRHTHIALAGKLLYDGGDFFIPWISGSAGIGSNHAAYYTNTPTTFEALMTPNFTNHTTSSFTYTLGAGVQHALSQHWQFGIGYEFADWGSSRLGPAPGQTEGHGLALSHFYSNGLLANFTYIA